jgi:energy-coupling factor transporter ATP-binding protein EcfA2
MPLGAVLDVLLTSIGPTKARPTIVAVDGRQGSGKSTLARHLADLVPESVVVHSDDVAWWESFFGWDHLMATGILDPLRRAESVDYRPPAWKRRGREGSIVVPSSAPLVIVEGVGSSRISLTPVIDAAVWVQSDWDEANRRGIAREGGGRAETDFWWEWDREEQPFLAHDRPWERAEIIVCGTPELTTVEHDPATQVLVGNTLAAKAQA